MLDSRPGQLVSGGVVAGNGTLEPQPKRIVEKVWGAVEKVMAEMRNLLINQLIDPSRSVEDQVKTIELSLQLRMRIMERMFLINSLTQNNIGYEHQRRPRLDLF